MSTVESMLESDSGREIRNEQECKHEWNEVRVWSLGATYIRYCDKCGSKETFTK